jgi:hypothetical protein
MPLKLSVIEVGRGSIFLYREYVINKKIRKKEMAEKVDYAKQQEERDIALLKHKNLRYFTSRMCVQYLNNWSRNDYENPGGIINNVVSEKRRLASLLVDALEKEFGDRIDWQANKNI